MADDIARILLVRTSAMGDIVHSLPALAALRARHPTARIAWVVERHFAPLLADHAAIDTVLTVRTRAWRQMSKTAAWREASAAIREIRGFRPDVAIDLMGNHKGAVLARLSGAGRVIGPRRIDRREPSSGLWIGEPVRVHGEHAVDRALSIVSAVGTASLGAEAPGTAAGDDRPIDLGGRGLLPSARPPGGEAPYAVIQVGAGWGNKQYPVDAWGQVARQLADAGLAVKVPIAPGEETLAESVVDAAEGAAEAVDARGFDSLVALLRGARVALGGDTGPIHLAHALGTRVVCVMGPTDPRRHGPYGALDHAIWHRLPCSFCYKRISGTRACLLAIPPDRVAARARSLANLESSERS